MPRSEPLHYKAWEGRDQSSKRAETELFFHIGCLCLYFIVTMLSGI